MPLITVRNLTGIGRAGNQLFLYCFAKGYAHAMGCDLHVPDWWGRKVFVNANEPLCGKELPQTENEAFSKKPLGYFFGQRDIDVNVFAQHQCYVDYFTRRQAREWLKIKPEFDNDTPALTKAGYSAAHLRHGDYLTEPWIIKNYCQISELSYLKAIQQFKVPEPVLFVHEGWRKQPLGTHGLDWWSDFLLLKNAKHLLRANSTFSWWASVLGNGTTYAPLVGALAGPNDVIFTEGNWPCTAGKFKNQSDLRLREE